MPLPDRPVDGAEIATDWGQQIHDATFAPRGCNVSGGATNVPNGGATVTIHLDTGIDDPGGWLDAAGDRIIAPTDSAGIYLCCALLHTVDLDTDDEVRAYIVLNGQGTARITEGGEGGTTMYLAISTILTISAGDIINVKAKKLGVAGAAVDLTLDALQIVRLGSEYGA